MSKVLVVDDESAAVEFLQEFLTSKGYEVISASDGAKALAKVSALRPKAILMVLAMPGMGGLAAIPRLRHSAEGAAIIALTLLDAHGYREAALAAGADEFVAKGNLSADLLPAIRRAVRSDRSPESGNGGVEAEREAWHRRTEHA
jgi:two-component system response regulator MprA